MKHWLLQVVWTVSLAAQTTWNVPDGNHPGPVIAQAAPGDVLVMEGAHPPFTLDKGLTLVPGGSSWILGGPNSTIYDETTFAIPPGQHAHVIGMSYAVTTTPWLDEWGWSTLVQSGSVQFESCSFFFLRVTGGDIVLQGCTGGSHLATNNSGLDATGANISAVACTFVGPDSTGNYPYDTTGRPGVRLTDSTLTAAGLSVTGGNGAEYGFATPPAQVGILCQGTSRVFITDSEVTGGDGWFVDAAAAIEAVGSSQVEHSGCTLQSGASTGGVVPPAVAGNVVASSGMVSVADNGMLVRGLSYEVTAVAGDQQELLAIFGAFALAPLQAAPLFVEPLWLDTTSLVLLQVAVPAANAAVQVSIAIPNTAAVAGADLWFQAVQFEQGVLRLSPVVGGKVQ